MRRGIVAALALVVLLGTPVAAAAGTESDLRLESAAFAEDGDISIQYSCATNTSPPLEWSAPPKKTKELALIVEDPDAPTSEPFVHWTVWRIKRSARALEEGVVPKGVRQGTTGRGTAGYFGPCPPRGEAHRYVFTLYALKKKLKLDDGADVAQFRSAIERAEDKNQVVAEATLTGLFTAPSA